MSHFSISSTIFLIKTICTTGTRAHSQYTINALKVTKGCLIVGSKKLLVFAKNVLSFLFISIFKLLSKINSAILTFYYTVLST